MLIVAGVNALTRLAHTARGGDDAALEAFIDGAYEPVWRLCASLVDNESAEDLAQETFIRAVRALPQFRGDASARTWLLAITRNTCMDELRSRSRRRRRDMVLQAGYECVDLAPDASQEITVADLISRLQPERRAAFVLTQLLGLTYQEAAQVCECPVGTIRSRVARARADLLGLLEPVALDRQAPKRGRSSSA
jgi:RNA polymerase sigma-70 factor (ECF subfamily)